MNYTTIYEDRLVVKCSEFGGAAADLVDAVQRLDGEIDKAMDKIVEIDNELAKRTKELETANEKIAELEREISLLQGV